MLATDEVRFPHGCSCDSAIVARFCADCGFPFDSEGFDARAKSHERLTGHIVVDHVFCDECHVLVAKGLKIEGKYYWQIMIVFEAERNTVVGVDRVTYEERIRGLLESRAR